MIPARLVDNGLVTKNPDQLYIVCLIIRILLSIMIYNNHLRPNVIYILCALSIIFFFSKLWKTKNNTWKNYTRTLITYSLVMFVTKTKSSYTTTNPAGLLMLFDTLLGMQSRFIFSKFKDS